MPPLVCLLWILGGSQPQGNLKSKDPRPRMMFRDASDEDGEETLCPKQPIVDWGPPSGEQITSETGNRTRPLVTLVMCVDARP